MNELIKHDHPDFAGLVDLGSCTIHIVHNAFGKGMQQCGKEIEQLCMDLHSLFKYSAADETTSKNFSMKWIWKCTISNSIQRYVGSV